MGPGSLFHDRKRRRIRTVTAASFPCFRLEWRLAAKASNTWKGVLLAEIRREMERLRPVYETGILRLLLRNNSMLYVALLRSTFDPLTGELPREIVEERFARSLNRLIETGDYTLKDGQTAREAAHSVLLDLAREKGRRLRLARQFHGRGLAPLPVPSHSASAPCHRSARPA